MTSANYKVTPWVYYKEEETYRMAKPSELDKISYLSHIDYCGKCGKSYGISNIIMMDFNKFVCESCYDGLNRVKLTLWEK